MKQALPTLALITVFGLACAGMDTPTPTPEPVLTTPPAPEPPPEPEPAPALVVEPGSPALLDGYGYVAGDPVRYSIPAPGDELYTTRRVPLRRAPDGETVGELPIGMSVEVIGVGPSAEHEGFENAWVEVRHGEQRGHVFGAFLTPFLLQSMGAVSHHIAVSWSPQFLPRITAWEDGGEPIHIDLPVTRKGGGGTIDVEVQPWGDPSSRTDVTQCVVGPPPADGPRCSTGSVVFEDEHLKILTPPDAWRFDPAPQTTTGACTTGLHSEAITRERLLETIEPTYARGDDSKHVCSAFARLTEGPATGKRLISCEDIRENKGPPPDFRATFFLELDRERWARLPCLDTSAELENRLAELGVKVVDGGDLADFRPTGVLGPWPEVLWEGEQGVATFARHVLWPTQGEPVWEHPELGPVYRARQGSAALQVPRPEGGHLLYMVPVPLKHPTLRGVEVTHGYEAGTDILRTAYFEPDIGPDPEVIGQSEVGPILAVGGPPLERLKGALRKRAPDAPLPPDPLIAVPAPFGGYHIAMRDDLKLHPFMAEPILYAYAPEPTEVAIRFGEGLEVARTDPPTSTGWEVVADRSGWLRHDGKRLPRLFWDGHSTFFPPPEQGWVVRTEALESHLRRVLPTLGLQGREIEEALDAWLPTVGSSPWIRVGVHPPEEVARHAPLEIEPEPDALIRVLVELAPLERPEPIVAPSWTPPERTGLVVVEWGYVLRGARALRLE